MNYIAANGYELYRCSKEAMRSCGLSKKHAQEKFLIMQKTPFLKTLRLFWKK